MRKLLIISAISLSLLMLCSLKTNAQQIKDQSIISVTATATKSFMPDTAIITLAVETKADSAQKAAAENSRKTEAVINRLNLLLKKDSGDLIKTSSYSIQSDYEYDNNLKKQVLTGYRVTNQVTIKTKQINNAGNIIDTAVNAGANQVNGINFIIENNNEYYKKVETEAINIARSQANSAAEALGLKVTGVKKVSISNNGAEPMFHGIRMMGIGANVIQPSTPIEPGEVKIDSNVDIDFVAQ